MNTSTYSKNDDWLEGDVSEPYNNETVDDAPYARNKNGPWNCLDPIVHNIAYCFACIQYHFVYHRLEFIMGFALILVVVLGVTGVVSAVERRHFHQQLEAAGISTDFTEISSKFDLKIGSVEHWCLQGGFQNCDLCVNPLEPIPSDKPHWRVAHEKNVHMIQHFFEAHGTTMGKRRHKSRHLMTQTTQYSAEDDYFLFLDDGFDDDMSDDDIHDQINTEHNFTNTEEKSIWSKVDPLSLVDVVFLGANTTELLIGRVLGRKNTNQEAIKQYFEEKFDKSKGADYNALALGIHGDTSSNILWRILNGELPQNLHPKLFWLTMGLDDLVSTSCSAEITLMGILRIVEELQTIRPEAKIVINSILPYSVEPLGYLEGWRKQKSERIDFWKAIKNVNSQLKTFANKHKNVEFYDSTTLFSEWSGKTLIMKGNLITRRGPQQDGYKLWIDAQLELIRKLIVPFKDQVITPDKKDASESKNGAGVVDDDFFDYYGDLDDYFST